MGNYTVKVPFVIWKTLWGATLLMALNNHLFRSFKLCNNLLCNELQPTYRQKMVHSVQKITPKILILYVHHTAQLLPGDKFA